MHRPRTHKGCLQIGGGRIKKWDTIRGATIQKTSKRRGRQRRGFAPLLALVTAPVVTSLAQSSLNKIF